MPVIHKHGQHGPHAHSNNDYEHHQPPIGPGNEEIILPATREDGVPLLDPYHSVYATQATPMMVEPSPNGTAQPDFPSVVQPARPAADPLLLDRVVQLAGEAEAWRKFAADLYEAGTGHRLQKMEPREAVGDVGRTRAAGQAAIIQVNKLNDWVMTNAPGAEMEEGETSIDVTIRLLSTCQSLVVALWPQIRNMVTASHNMLVRAGIINEDTSIP